MGSSRNRPTKEDIVTATETAKVIRAQLKIEGVKARCRVAPGSKDCVQVFVPKFGMTFTDNEQRTIRTIGVNLGLTWVRGLPIDVDRMTDPHGMDFHLPACSGSSAVTAGA
jgi:hypothetical protein